MKILRQREEIVLGSQLGVDARRIYDVIALRAAHARREDGGTVEMRDAEARDVLDSRASVRQREARVHLQAIGRREAPHATRAPRISCGRRSEAPCEPRGSA